MKRTTPPYRADHVGSYLRTPAITEARAKRDKGQISAADLKKVEDQEIPKVIKKQEEVGLQCATDGEYRRMFWHYDFYDGLDNVEIYEMDHGIQFQGVQTKPKGIRIKGKIDFSNHPMLEHFKFVKQHTKVMPKMCIPSPTVLHFRLEPNAIVDKKTYPNNDAIFSDLSAAYRKAVKAFYDAGCRYLQFDDTAWAYLCSDVEMKKAKERGMNVATIADDYTRVINDSIKDKPADMVITTHVCRGNFRSTWISSGGYEPVAERMLGQCNYDGYFLEYDSERAGGFEPLRFLPRGKKIAVVGVITSKSGTLESKDTVKRRIDEASKFAPLEQLALSPQCGFASTEEGNVLTEEQQWAKMREVVEVADEIWGK
jgi:5-methyltetrahydropteroyltriglutamate--homocysteine methyltransferase